jgi:hypothetical protein
LFIQEKNLQNLKVNVLYVGDGYGYGENYQLLRNKLQTVDIQLANKVMDNKQNCLFDQKIFRYFDEISFTDTKPENYCVWIILIDTLQYIREWRNFLYDLARLAPKFIDVS